MGEPDADFDPTDPESAAPGGASWEEVPGLVARGLCMGTADVVPGVSGGTMALILGIYVRLVAAIRSLDFTALRRLLRFDLAGIHRHVGWRFLGAVVCGQAIGVVLFTRVFPLPRYLQTHPEQIYGLFFGLVLGSIFMLGRDVARHEEGGPAAALLAALAGFGAGLLVVTAVPTDTPETPLFVFFCGCVSICAMILPGISGSFVLLILRKYAYVLGKLGEVIRPYEGGGRLEPFLEVVLPFACGCAIGLLAFARLLTWLLGRAERATLSFMTGLMAGSLYALWPFAERTWTVVRDKKRLIGSTPRLPDLGAGSAWASLGLLALGVVGVLALERLARRSPAQPAAEEGSPQEPQP